MKKYYYQYLVIVFMAPILFWYYLKVGLVCLPRAVFFEVYTGILSASLLSLAVLKKKRLLYNITLMVPVVITLITPVIMLKRLGWETFVDRRLVAFFTFETIAFIQIYLILILKRIACKGGDDKSS